MPSTGVQIRMPAEPERRLDLYCERSGLNRSDAFRGAVESVATEYALERFSGISRHLWGLALDLGCSRFLEDAEDDFSFLDGDTDPADAEIQDWLLKAEVLQNFVNQDRPEDELRAKVSGFWAAMPRKLKDTVIENVTTALAV